jgi:hypothetical protein
MNVTLLCLQDTVLQIGILPKVPLLRQVHGAHHARIGNSFGLLIGWTSTPPRLLQKPFSKNCNVGDTYSSAGYDFQGPCVPGDRCEARGTAGFSNIDRPGVLDPKNAHQNERKICSSDLPCMPFGYCGNAYSLSFLPLLAFLGTHQWFAQCIRYVAAELD